LKGRRFDSIEAQNEFLAHWEKNWAAKRIHGTERRQVQAMFDEERAHLQALPLVGMQYFEEAERTVCDDSCVRVQHSSYAARPAAIGAKVLVRIYAQRIEIREQFAFFLRSRWPELGRADDFASFWRHVIAELSLQQACVWLDRDLSVP
jgi:hypothetical protein